MQPETQTALRELLLTGRLTQADGEQQLRRFLVEARGALRLWFGAAADAICRDARLLRGMIDRDIARIDALIARQLDAILHHERLLRLEGSWRGLQWLVSGLDPSAPVKVRLLSVRWDEMARDLARAAGFDQSALFRLIYESEFGHAGGQPFGLLLVDHELRHRPDQRAAGAAAPVDDVSVLADLAPIAAAAFAPLVLAAAPSMLDVEQFGELAHLQDVTAGLHGADHARWQALRRREDARFVCLALPRILARPRWDGAHSAHNGLRFAEHAPDAAARCWFSPGFAFAALAARAFATHGWPADVRGVTPDREGGGLVRQLPREDFSLGAATRLPRQQLDIVLTDMQERALAAAGFMPLNTLPHGEAMFASAHSIQARTQDAPGRGPTAATANRRLSAYVNAMLCVSRFAHYVKIIGRDMTGAFARADEIERRLQSWLAGYTNASRLADADSRARHPLLASQVSVREQEGRPGAFTCVILLQPFHQMDDVSATFRLVTGFAAPGRAEAA